MSSIGGIEAVGSDKLRIDYMNLLVTQMKNQNPLEPMSNDEMTAQLATISQLEQLENISGSFEKALAGAQLSQGTALIGKTITFVPPEGEYAVQGQVERADLSGEQVLLAVGDYRVPLSSVQSVTE